MSEQLSVCPFCGGRARVQEGRKGYEVKCTVPDCGASVYGFNILDNAVEAWNRRDAERSAVERERKAFVAGAWADRLDAMSGEEAEAEAVRHYPLPKEASHE